MYMKLSKVTNAGTICTDVSKEQKGNDNYERTGEVCVETTSIQYYSCQLFPCATLFNFFTHF